jgi:hypothetical protein
MSSFHALVDRELFGYLQSTGERVYRNVQAAAQWPPARMQSSFVSHCTEYALRVRSSIDLILPDLLAGLTPRLTSRERAMLADLGRWARYYSSGPVQWKLRRFLAAVKRLPVHGEAA